MKPLRIVIADDFAAIREVMRMELSNVPGLTTVGEASDGAQAFWLYHQMYPDVLILDLTMPKASGLEVLQKIREHDKSTVIIIFTADPSLVLREACLHAGANFYFDKSDMKSVIETCRSLQKKQKISWAEQN